MMKKILKFNFVLLKFMLFSFIFIFFLWNLRTVHAYDLNLGQTLFLDEKKLNSTNSKWWTNTPEVAVVDNKGFVSGVDVGDALIVCYNQSNGTRREVHIKVLEPKPIQFCFTSPNIVLRGQQITFHAITDSRVSKLNFDIIKNNNRIIIGASKNGTSNGKQLWTAVYNINGTGVYNVEAYAEIYGNWITCDDGKTDIFVTDDIDKNSMGTFCRRVSDECINFVLSCEGFESNVYKDLAGISTIGYGKCIYHGDAFYNHLTPEEAKSYFIKNINSSQYSNEVNAFLVNNNIQFNQHQFDALVSFCYNLGCGWLKNHSTLSRYLLNTGLGETQLMGNVESNNGLNVRVGPNASEKKVCVLRNKTNFKILNPNKINSNWYHIQTLDGKIGYCCSDFVNTYQVGTQKNLNNIDKNNFALEFLCYHHVLRNCVKGLFVRRIYELDMFFDGKYSNFNSKYYLTNKYPIPPCIKKYL